MSNNNTRYEYVYLDKPTSLNEFLETLNDFGEEGYQYISAEYFGVPILERAVPPTIEASTTIKPYASNHVSISQAAVFILSLVLFLMVFFMVAGGLHWLR